MKKKMIVLVFTILLITGVTGIASVFRPESKAGKGILLSVLNLINAGIAYAAMKRTDMKLDLDVKNKKQYLVGFCIAYDLTIAIAILPALCGYSLVGGHREFSKLALLFYFFYYMLIVGPAEELIFRVYMQDTLVSMLKKHKWIGVVLASLLFGAWHLINGSLMQAAFTFGIGMIFGMCKYTIKSCKFIGLALAHGIYDFLIVVVTMFIVPN